MDRKALISAEERRILEEQGVDVSLSLTILDDFNTGKAGTTPPVIPDGVPEIDGESIVDMRGTSEFDCSPEELERLGKNHPEAAACLNPSKGTVTLKQLYRAGLALLPRFAYGFLNGGSATSYGDEKKNRGFNSELFSLYENEFRDLADLSRGRPKGVTPAFLQPDGEKGPSYMEMKLRSLLVLMEKYRREFGSLPSRGIPFFQMTSVSNNDDVQKGLKEYETSPWLRALADRLGYPAFEGFTEIQPLITAFTHSDRGSQKDVFRNPEKDFPFIVLPGGHGQCFRVLRKSWQKLYDRGVRFISLGNIDNLGYTPDPAELALLALRDRPAGFDESFKTAVDVKGGILVNTADGGLNCVDLGVGISHKDADALEASGKKILFNCGSGLFKLGWLLENLDRIIQELPLRFSDQNKDAGHYSQAEQVTWEVIGMIDKPLIFAVDKYKRFLAAKILLENMMTSGLKLDDESFPGDGTEGDLKDTARRLHEGLKGLLPDIYGLELKEGRWSAS